jgi:hypothetical protein
MKYLDRINDTVWRATIKNATFDCLAEIDKQRSNIIEDFAVAPFNISADQCDVTHMVLLTCIHLESYAVGFHCLKILLTKQFSLKFILELSSPILEQFEPL